MLVRLLPRLQAYGISLSTMMAKQLLAGGAPGLHMYTLNLERSAVAILENCGLLPTPPPSPKKGGENGSA